jgi:hypothetical protein
MKRFEPIEGFDIVPEKGRYRRAILINLILSAFVLVPLAVVSGIAEKLLCFRLAYWLDEKLMDMFAFKVWLMQRVYLGCDPRVWELLTK